MMFRFESGRGCSSTPLSISQATCGSSRTAGWAWTRPYRKRRTTTGTYTRACLSSFVRVCQFHQASTLLILRGWCRGTIRGRGFREVENLVLTDASLVNANNVNPFIADWAETGDATAIPAGKLGNAPAGGLTLIAESTVRSMARTIGAADVIAGRTLGAGDFVLAQCSHVNGDGDVQASRGWNEPYLIGTKVNFDWAVEDMTAIALHATNVAGEIQVSVLGGTNPIADLYRIRVFRFAIN